MPRIRYTRSTPEEAAGPPTGEDPPAAPAGPPPEPRTKPSPQMIAAMAHFLEAIGLDVSRALALIDEAEKAEREEFARKLDAARAARKR